MFSHPALEGQGAGSFFFFFARARARSPIAVPSPAARLLLFSSPEQHDVRLRPVDGIVHPAPGLLDADAAPLGLVCGGGRDGESVSVGAKKGGGGGGGGRVAGVGQWRGRGGAWREEAAPRRPCRIPLPHTAAPLPRLTSLSSFPLGSRAAMSWGRTTWLRGKGEREGKRGRREKRGKKKQREREGGEQQPPPPGALYSDPGAPIPAPHAPVLVDVVIVLLRVLRERGRERERERG